MIEKEQEEKQNYYIDNATFLEELRVWKEKRDLANENGEDEPVMPDSIALKIISIAKNLATKNNFKNYTYIEEMIGDGIFAGFKAASSFDPNRKNKQGYVNPFGFFSLVIWNAFIARLNSEKKIQAAKMALIFDPSQATYATQDNEEYNVNMDYALGVYDNRL